MKGELYEYNGQMLTQAQIAKLENINRATLADWYKRTKNMNDAVAGAKKSLAQRNISYYDEILSLKAISVKEQIKFESLKKFYEECNDIYRAVELTKEAQVKRNGSILYNGQMLTILAISKLENLEHHALGKYYKDTNDIYKSIELAKKAKAKQNGTILYKGSLMTITGIANLENIKRDTLKELYELYENIDKAVFLTKESQKRRRQSLYKNRLIDVESFSKYYKIPIIKLNEMIESGLTLDIIENQIKEKAKTKSQKEPLMYNGQSLYQYCLDNGYNYWVISYIVNKYNKSVDEALKEYINNGQQIPTKWIYEKYNILFKHLMLTFGIDSNRVIKIMKFENCDIEDALIKLIFITDKNLKSLESNWLEEIYRFIKASDSSELQNIYETFYVDEREKNILSDKDKQIETIKRQLLLFEFSEIIDLWNKDELNKMFDLYNISDNEIITIYSELYQPFIDGVINPTSESKETNNRINNCIRNCILNGITENDFLEVSEAEKKYCLSKIELINTVLSTKNKMINSENFNCK